MTFTHFSCDSRLVSPGWRAWRRNPAISSACAGRNGTIKSQEMVLPACQADAVRENGRVESTQSPRKGNHRMLLRRAEKRNKHPSAQDQSNSPAGAAGRITAQAFGNGQGSKAQYPEWAAQDFIGRAQPHPSGIQGGNGSQDEQIRCQSRFQCRCRDASQQGQAGCGRDQPESRPKATPDNIILAIRQVQG